MAVTTRLSDCPPEILLHIAKFILSAPHRDRTSSRSPIETVKALARSCRRIRDSLSPLIFKRATIWEGADVHKLLRAGDRVLNNIRHLRIQTPQSSISLVPLQHRLPSLTTLVVGTDIRLDVDRPFAIIRTLVLNCSTDFASLLRCAPNAETIRTSLDVSFTALQISELLQAIDSTRHEDLRVWHVGTETFSIDLVDRIVKRLPEIRELDLVPRMRKLRWMSRTDDSVTLENIIASLRPLTRLRHLSLPYALDGRHAHWEPAAQAAHVRAAQALAQALPRLEMVSWMLADAQSEPNGAVSKTRWVTRDGASSSLEVRKANVGWWDELQDDD